MNHSEQVISHLFLLGYLICVILVLLRVNRYGDKTRMMKTSDLTYCLNVGGIGIGLLTISVIIILYRAT